MQITDAKRNGTGWRRNEGHCAAISLVITGNLSFCNVLAFVIFFYLRHEVNDVAVNSFVVEFLIFCCAVNDIVKKNLFFLLTADMHVLITKGKYHMIHWKLYYNLIILLVDLLYEMINNFQLEKKIF